MNHQTEKNEHASFREALKKAPGRFWNALKHNLGWKILALLLSICLWAGLISQDPTLTRKKTFTDVKVSVNGEETLLNNGLIILSGLEEPFMVTSMDVQVPQRNYSTANAANYAPRVDVNRITDTGEQTLRLQATSSSTYGSVQSITPETVTVIVDEYITNYRVPVTINRIGELPEGFYGSSPTLDPGVVAISGPRSIVDTISHVQVDYDLSKLPAREGQTRMALAMHVIDIHGAELSQDKLRITSASIALRSITLDQRLYPKREMRISANIQLTGSPAPGYEVKSISVSPETLIAAGESTALATVDTLFADDPISVEGASKTFSTDFAIRKPSSLVYMSTDTAMVTVEIGPIISNVTLDGVKLTARGLSDKQKVTLKPKTVSVTVTGPVNSLENLSASKMKAYVDIESLNSGIFTLPVVVEFENKELSGINYVVEPAVVEVTLVEK